MVRRKRASRFTEPAAHVSDAMCDAEMALATATAFAHADTRLSSPEAAEYPDWGHARELAFFSSGGKTDKPPYLDAATAREAATRAGRKAVDAAAHRAVGELPRALHRSWATFLLYKREYEKRNSVRLELLEETSVDEYNSELAERVSGRTRATRSGRGGADGGAARSELPPELVAWQRVFHCTSAEADDAACAFEWTATVEFVGDEWMVRVADGCFVHSHALRLGGEPERAASPPLLSGRESLLLSQDEAVSPLREPASNAMRAFLRSPTVPTMEEYQETILTLRQKQGELRAVVDEIYSELMKWEPEYFLSEVNNLTEYLGRLKERGEEVARLDRAPKNAYADTLRYVSPALMGIQDSPLYGARQYRQRDGATTSEELSPWVKALLATSAAAGGLEHVVDVEQSDLLAEAVRSTSTRGKATRRTDVSEQRSSMASTSSESSPDAAALARKRTSERVLTVAKTNNDLSTSEDETRTPRPARSSMRNSEAVAAKSTRSVQIPDSGALRTSVNAEPRRFPVGDTESTQKRTPPVRMLGLTIDTAPEISAKRRRTSPAGVDGTRGKSTTPTQSAAQKPARTREKPHHTSLTLAIGRPSETAEEPPRSMSRALSTQVKPRVATQPAAAGSSTSSRRSPLSAKTKEQVAAKSKSPRQQSKTATGSLIISTSDPTTRRRSRSKSPAPLTPHAAAVEVVTHARSKSKSPSNKQEPTKKPSISEDATAKPSHPAWVVVKTSTTSSEKSSVVATKAWLGKSKHSASTVSKKPKTPTGSSPKPVEMHSKFSKYPPLHSFRGEAPARTTQDTTNDIAWDVVLVPRSSLASQQPVAAQQSAPPTPPSPPRPRAVLL